MDMKKIRKIMLIIALLSILCVIAWCLQHFVRGQEITGATNDEVTITVQPTPTKCPDIAPVTFWMNGKLYSVEPVSKSYANFHEEDYIGSVEKEVAPNKTPNQEMASNCMPIGTKIYKSFYSDDIYYGVGEIKNNICYYRIYLFATEEARQPIQFPNSDGSQNEPYVIKTYYSVSDTETTGENDELTIFVKHYEMSDGTWKTDKHTYQYRLEVTGRINNAASDITFVYLSNVEDISFDKAWKAAGLSSNRDDYFDSAVAILVAMKY